MNKGKTGLALQTITNFLNGNDFNKKGKSQRKVVYVNLNYNNANTAAGELAKLG